ncbi:DAPG hydrolase family protein [Calidifontibacter terrae]
MDDLLSPADLLPTPAVLTTEPRRLGYSDFDRSRPYAHFFSDAVRPLQAGPREALAGTPAPAELAYEVDDAVSRLARPGYEPVENGWARTARGTTFVACHTDMPGVTASMWDWWFGWHSSETARYKLWHPGAHQFAAWGDDRSADRTLTDRQRYQSNVSYVDKYIGDTLTRLAIRFVDPQRLGFEDRRGTTRVWLGS